MRERRARTEPMGWGGDMGLEARAAAGDSASHRAGRGEVWGWADKTLGVSGRGRAEKLDITSGAGGSRVLDITRWGDETRQLGGNIGGGRFLFCSVLCYFIALPWQHILRYQKSIHFLNLASSVSWHDFAYVWWQSQESPRGVFEIPQHAIVKR